MCQAHDHASSDSLMLRNLHHDPQGELEQSGHLQLLNKKIDQFGVYRADAYMHGLLKLGATFFPQSWSHEQLVTKILEAYDDFVSAQPRIAIQPNGIIQGQGKTKEGIVIFFCMTAQGEMIVAYPELQEQL